MWKRFIDMGITSLWNAPKGTVEYFTPMANKRPRGGSHHQLEGMFKKVRPARPQPF